MEVRPNAHGRLLIWLAGLAVASIVLVPLAVTPDAIDRFRVLKESLARATGILGALGVVTAVSLWGTERLRAFLRHRALLAVAAAGTVWILLTTALSTQRAYSLDSLVTFVTSLFVFITVWYAAPRLGLVILDVLVAVVAINAGLAALQESGRWQPFRLNPADPLHLGTTGLIDNPNVLGSYMALAAVILTVAAIGVRGVRRWLYAFGAVCAAGAVLVSQTRGALLALAAGVVLIMIGGSVKRAVAAGVAVALLFGIGVAVKVPAVMRLLDAPRLAREEGLEVASSGRVAPVLAGLQMLRDRPVTGVGPGAFKSHYMQYKLGILDDYGRLVRGTSGMMFGEVHNDHVQILAETGVVGYGLFVAALVALVLAVRKSSAGEPRGRIVRRLALPLAGTLVVLALVQFPLYVPVTRHLLVVFAGLLAGWSDAE
ncbi:MAG TPA: O-antigen ligase family protein [Thermoanaerobaculia bacterium]|nr:O-antigen ligase family protein [Thermoanaerobaculia bacterium]